MSYRAMWSNIAHWISWCTRHVFIYLVTILIRRESCLPFTLTLCSSHPGRRRRRRNIQFHCLPQPVSFCQGRIDGDGYRASIWRCKQLSVSGIAYYMWTALNKLWDLPSFKTRTITKGAYASTSHVCCSYQRDVCPSLNTFFQYVGLTSLQPVLK